MVLMIFDRERERERDKWEREREKEKAILQLSCIIIQCICFWTSLYCVYDMMTLPSFKMHEAIFYHCRQWVHSASIYGMSSNVSSCMQKVKQALQLESHTCFSFPHLCLLLSHSYTLYMREVGRLLLYIMGRYRCKSIFFFSWKHKLAFLKSLLSKKKTKFWIFIWVVSNLCCWFRGLEKLVKYHRCISILPVIFIVI